MTLNYGIDYSRSGHMIHVWIAVKWRLGGAWRNLLSFRFSPFQRVRRLSGARP